MASRENPHHKLKKILGAIIFFIYYINISKIPSEFSRENFTSLTREDNITRGEDNILSSHVKRSPAYGYIINRAFFTGVYPVFL